mmetsp:Transcript_4421/g.8490  ORF Transcript_4421/g.8490 Transcript_4421/m.8490 type:complete len:503 (+) Transcript_4421:47-1555(+)
MKAVGFLLQALLGVTSSTTPEDFFCWDKSLFDNGESAPFLTREMCRKSIRNVGGSRQLEPMMRKLQTGQCIRIGVLGGSISAGHTLKPGELTWAKWLTKKLNRDFKPVSDKKGKPVCQHAVGNMSRKSMSVDHWISMLSNAGFVKPLRSFDLIILESATNDINELVLHEAASPNDWLPAVLPAPSITERFVEIFVRKAHILLPSTALMSVTAGWRGLMVQGGRATDPPSQPPYHLDAEDSHLAVLSYYDLPQVSILAALSPLGSLETRTWIQDHIYSDYICHTNALGHKTMAMLLIHWLETNLAEFDIKKNSGVVDHVHASPLTLAPLWVNATDMLHFLFPPVLSVDFTLAPGKEPWLAKHASFLNIEVQIGSWRHFEDRPGKFGLIAQSVTAQPLEFAFESDRNFVLVSVGALHSYEGVGAFKAELFSAESGVQSGAPLASVKTDCWWPDHVSEEASSFIRYEISGAPIAPAIRHYLLRISVYEPEGRSGTKVRITRVVAQ